ncbi:UNVERIFIED_CONTAM: Retrovirus-related Pol polyprotein from transposon TNT 1-94 [Sesamum radiatum]|uniref:Retrovirus-related Pol polyprotein from transposon TNT 1-94 n=1 Tax=Sesamum radiatum TaxID=300843 RepID=A0AAW2R113_SESRA
MWGEAVLSACYVLNRVPHKKLDKTPHELWKGFAPNLRYLKVWGCLAKVAYPVFKRPNIGPKTFDCVFIGYAHNSAAYRFMCLNDNSICESRDAEFFELEFPLNKAHNPLIVSNSSITASAPSTIELRRSKRRKIETSFGPDFLSVFLAENVDKINEHVISAFLIDEDPKSYTEAITSIDSSFWKEAIKNELDSIMENHTWELADLPTGSKPIKCKWVFRRKIRPDGSLDKFKARLVVVGYTQRKDIDYFDTYSPVTKIATIRTLIALSAIYGLIIHQMDVKTAFLNGDLKEEIYMEQPEGFVISGQENKVCKLNKSLYGLKQAPKQWYEKFDHTLITNGYRTNASDTCVYSKSFGLDYVIICLYVDDMLIFGTNLMVINDTKSFLSSQFEMKDLGEADVILGVKIRKTENGFSLCQSHYIEKILRKFNCYDELPVRTPYDPSICLKKNHGDSVSQAEYAKIIGSVMFLMNYTRPDIAYAVSRSRSRVLRTLVGDMPMWGSSVPVSLHCDSQAAIGIAKNYAYNGKRRHIRIRHSAVRELLKNGIISLEYVRSERNLADPLTKGLTRRVILETSRAMGLNP